MTSVFCVYLPGMKNREERSKHFFDSGPLMEEDEDLALYDKVRALCLFQVLELSFFTLLMCKNLKLVVVSGKNNFK